MRLIPLLSALLLLSACGDETREAGGVTRGEADGLDDAAEMVEQQRLPAEALATQPAPAPTPVPPPVPPAKAAPKPGG